jgi:hypothetical protein
MLDESNVNLSGRFRYKGSTAGSLDENLMSNITSGFNEERVVLLYREDASQEWEAYEGQTLSPNSLTNKIGLVDATELKSGEYCFGLRLWPIDIEEYKPEPGMTVFPNPSSGNIQISIHPDIEVRGLMLFSAEGKTVINYLADEIKQEQIIALPDTGLYHIIMTDAAGKIYRDKVVVDKE